VSTYTDDAITERRVLAGQRYTHYHVGRSRDITVPDGCVTRARLPRRRLSSLSTETRARAYAVISRAITAAEYFCFRYRIRVNDGQGLRDYEPRDRTRARVREELHE